MHDFFEALVSSIQTGGAAFAALIVVVSILRGLGNQYLSSSTYVLDGFSLNPAATGEAMFICISGRRKGMISWIMTILGMETRINLTVGAKEWTLRSGSLASMLNSCVPLGHVKEAICGYQRSLMALFLMIFFVVNSAWVALAGIPRRSHFRLAHSEATQEQSAVAFSFRWDTFLCGLLWPSLLEHFISSPNASPLPSMPSVSAA